MAVEVLAPIAGKILEIHVKVGDEVHEDDELISIEAMKMENPIYAQAGGVVKEIKIKKEEQVEEDQVLLVLE